jgi:hypothetical protein
MRDGHPFGLPWAGRGTAARTAQSHAIGSKQIVERESLAALILRERFVRHTSNDAALFSEAPLPGLLIGERVEDLWAIASCSFSGRAAIFSSASCNSMDKPRC